jgi:hypothetical protein
MTFTSTTSKPTHRADYELTDLKTPISTDRPEDNSSQPIAKFSKSSIAGALVAIVGVTILQNLLWMSASSPAELPTCHKQATLTTVK